MCQGGKHRLEKGVDGHHTEVVVAVKNLMKCFFCPIADGGVAQWLRESRTHRDEHPHVGHFVVG
jgi:hypothetical protein